MKVATPKERAQDERRVALVPDTAAKLIAAGLDVTVEEGAGVAAFFSDNEYEKAGVVVVKDAASLLKDADAVLKVQAPAVGEIDLIKKGAVLISFLQPSTQGDIVRALAKRGVTVNVLAPGYIETDMTAELAQDQVLAQIPAGRFGKPEEVAAAAVFLCTDAAAYITGAVLNINGGIYT